MENIISRFAENIAVYNNYSNDQKEEIEYTLKIIIYETTKILFLIIMFYFVGYLSEALVILFVMSITKPFIGGYHEDSQIKCFIATSILIFIIIQFVKEINITFWGSVLLNSISIFAIYNKAPIINEKMPITKENLIRRNRLIGILNALILAIISLSLFNLTQLAKVIVWTILIQCIFMFNKNEYKFKI